jgi:hypothetical protein
MFGLELSMIWAVLIAVAVFLSEKRRCQPFYVLPPGRGTARIAEQCQCPALQNPRLGAVPEHPPGSTRRRRIRNQPAGRSGVVASGLRPPRP